MSLEAQITQGARHLLLARAVPAVAIAAGAAGALMGAGAPAWAGGLVLLAAAPWLRPIPGAKVAACLDAVADLDGAVACAWDHRASAAPVPVAQRARAVSTLQARGVRAAPRPHLAWALLLGTWAWPLSQRTVAPVEGVAAGLVTPGQTLAAAPTDVTPDSDAPPADATPDAGARARAPGAAPPDAGPPGSSDRPGGEVAGTAQAGGVGREAGDRSGGTAGRAHAAASAPAGPSVAVAGAAGTRLAPTARGHLLIAPSLSGGAPLDDDIADPARPYPPRHHRVVARWFARERSKL